MASEVVLNQEQSIALQEAIETIERLAGDATTHERLSSAQNDVVGRTMEGYVFAMVVAGLTRVVAAQHERIEVLEKALQKKPAKK